MDERIIREITIFDHARPSGTVDAVAAKVDTENPHRAGQLINSHPGRLPQTTLRTHGFNLDTTSALSRLRSAA